MRIKRSMWCSQSSSDFAGKSVSVVGWVDRRRDHGGVIFINLRDRTGNIQLVFNPDIENTIMYEARTLRNEFVIAVKGLFEKREIEAINPKMETGEFEIKVTELEILGTSTALPFQQDEAERVSDDLKLKYRYYDLRRPKMHDIIKLRHDVVFFIRQHLHKNGFYEIETPILSKSTPEGARDFLVPSRLQHKNFYALPQSPQIYKQLLMCAGLERYFQMARCFRDEDLRANRQLEHTQLDMEISFIDEEGVYSAIEKLFSLIWKKFLGVPIKLPLKRMTYDSVFHEFGTDKPDTRFDLKIQDVTKTFEYVQLKFLQPILEGGGKVGALCVKNKKFSRSELDGWVDKVIKEFGAKGLIYIGFKDKKTPSGPIAKFLPESFFSMLKNEIPDLTTKDTIFASADEYSVAWDLLGRLRIELGKSLKLIDKSKHAMFWVTDWPMFERNENENRWEAKHHPFTSPQKGWEQLDTDKIKARAYDLVYNGEELGGGSIRIHDSETQYKVFELLGISREKAKQKFGCLLEAQNMGYPPHGGIAFGLDRIMMMLAGADSIRDVIPFPKTQSGQCLMMETPSAVEEKQLLELGIKTTNKK
jgi:aspartyl-tRNA synthetase